MPELEVPVARPYRLTQTPFSYIHERRYPAGSVVLLLPNEVDGTMEEVGAPEYLAAELAGAVVVGASVAEAGYISLNGSNANAGRVTLDSPRLLRFRGTSDLSGVNFDLYGTDKDGAPIDEVLRGPSLLPGAPEAVTKNEYGVVTGLSATGPVNGLTVDALETRPEVDVRVKVTTERQRALYLNAARSAAEESEIQELLLRRKALTDQPKRTPREDAELSQLNTVLADPRPAARAIEHPRPAAHPSTKA